MRKNITILVAMLAVSSAGLAGDFPARTLRTSGVCGNEPCRLTNTFARLPSRLTTTVACTVRLPALSFAHIGSMPILITGFPGNLPFNLT